MKNISFFYRFHTIYEYDRKQKYLIIDMLIFKMAVSLCPKVKKSNSHSCLLNSKISTIIKHTLFKCSLLILDIGSIGKEACLRFVMQVLHFIN